MPSLSCNLSKGRGEGVGGGPQMDGERIKNGGQNTKIGKEAVVSMTWPILA